MQDGHSATRSAALNGAALASVAVGSGLQVALYLRDFGATHHTDGMIASLAVYSMVTVIAQLLRTTAVPLLSGANARLTETLFGLDDGWARAVHGGCLRGLLRRRSRT